MARLKEIYEKEIKVELLKEGGYRNVMEVPTLRKIVVNSGVGEATTNSSAIEEVVEIIELITGQKAVVSKSKKAVSTFKLREGMDIGVYTTLRGEKMWEFFDKLVNVVFPRTKDFRGVSYKAFDGSGNYSLGIEEHTVFPEIDPNKVQKLRSLQVTIVTSAQDDKDAKLLLDKFGFPFKKDGKKV
ncbi:50S ribosomal protein L5 [Candidatus Nomurabacteria bacterium]|uniref:Large ribosomal subunit protein uL5 n=1 Tax=Candidatus Dojkabacteria bacterium TaxID=2099670 RepID=A0A955I2M8_9BACT|nr:50S ribosomal protein L5 [Candidatus Dojkabacteria bacterium]MCB9789410.1 50S ribosomal protein L5 [Candidatus Nomurabacteria bacterium]MCB9803732.1 50S ribosomal protein L5 [Candidatus Nomurabacteria bacterium]